MKRKKGLDIRRTRFGGDSHQPFLLCKKPWGKIKIKEKKAWIFGEHGLGAVQISRPKNMILVKFLLFVNSNNMSYCLCDEFVFSKGDNVIVEFSNVFEFEFQ